MKRAKASSLLLFLVLCLVILAAFSTIEARKHHGKKIKIHKNKRSRHGDASLAPAPSPLPNSGPPVFNILSFGARANRVSDDSKALLKAWKSACKVTGGIVEIPVGLEFLIKPLTLQGPCRPNLVLQIDGTLLAPSKIWSSPKSSLYQWMNFKWLQNFTIKGAGTVDGQGSNWWASSQPNQKKAKRISDIKPTAMRFYKSYDIKVNDISIINSPLCHLKFDDSKRVKVKNVTISAPENSPNTDGIHLQNSQDVEILHSDIGTGDDCVSIQTGCSNIHVHHINCGPGHGISIGGLGKDKRVAACVSNVLVENIAMRGTLYGARIKTWQGGQGSVKNVTFSDIQATDVKVPIMIDQYYCDKNVCKNQTGAVSISGVRFDGIRGTYTAQPIHLACSSSVPCIDVELVGVELEPSARYGGFQAAMCWNSYGKTSGRLAPACMDDCVRSGSDVVRRISRSREGRCW
ncbi:polygalacturonase At1g48100-like isoform X1 [Salvia splendens]|uniref:polygalacturonase At1g48100-like isoform X1 n=1 Tax=Salvia splendens TaxID=180675 RepID=UPI001C26401C|nr:polygalacturonase At1g48100-like isoform X1 [Salvia splendens]